MNSTDMLDKLMTNTRIKSLGLRKESVLTILHSYNDIVMNSLLENGHIELDNGMNIEIVKLLDRVHVLRGISYKSSRRYKLKLTMEDTIYEKIEKYYDNIEEEIL